MVKQKKKVLKKKSKMVHVKEMKKGRHLFFPSQEAQPVRSLFCDILTVSDVS